MENKMIGYTDQVAAGDRVYLIEKKFSGGTEEVSAKVLEIREILGKQTYVVET
jgi:hypothetical protein